MPNYSYIWQKDEQKVSSIRGFIEQEIVKYEQKKLDAIVQNMNKISSPASEQTYESSPEKINTGGSCCAIY